MTKSKYPKPDIWEQTGMGTEEWLGGYGCVLVTFILLLLNTKSNLGEETTYFILKLSCHSPIVREVKKRTQMNHLKPKPWRNANINSITTYLLKIQSCYLSNDFMSCVPDLDRTNYIHLE